MYLCPSKSLRGIEILSKNGEFTAVTFTFDSNQSFLWRCLSFPKALYRFANAHFCRYRATPKESPIHDFVCYFPTRGDFAVFLELPSSGINNSMEING